MHYIVWAAAPIGPRTPISLVWL